jgi:hypothetical protein
MEVGSRARYYAAGATGAKSKMINMQRTILAAAVLCIFSGCNSKPAPPAEPPPVQDTAFGDMVGTVDKARGVQDTVDAQKQALDQQLKAAEGADDSSQ